jgi:hypothetical protein
LKEKCYSLNYSWVCQECWDARKYPSDEDCSDCERWINEDWGALCWYHEGKDTSNEKVVSVDLTEEYEQYKYEEWFYKKVDWRCQKCNTREKRIMKKVEKNPDKWMCMSCLPG